MVQGNPGKEATRAGAQSGEYIGEPGVFSFAYMDYESSGFPCGVEEIGIGTDDGDYLSGIPFDDNQRRHGETSLFVRRAGGDHRDSGSEPAAEAARCVVGLSERVVAMNHCSILPYRRQPDSGVAWRR